MTRITERERRLHRRKRIAISTVAAVCVVADVYKRQMEDLDCLFQPQNYPVVWKREECDCPPGRQQACRNVCEFDAIRPRCV